VNNKSNAILVGMIFIIVGVCFLLREYFNIDVGNIIYAVLGFALILLYKNKNKIWALVPGIYLIYIGFAPNFYIFGIDSSHLFAAMFFLVPSIIYMIKFIETKNISMMTLMCRFGTIGILIIANKLLDVNIYNLFLILLGICLILEYILSNGYFSNKRLYIGSIILVLSLWNIFRNFYYIFIVLIGILIIAKSIENKKN